MLLERSRVTSRKLTILLFDDISILKPKSLKALIIFFCILELFGPLLFGIYIIPSSRYRPNCSELIILFSICNIYRPIRSAIYEESYPPIGTSKFTGPLFIHVVPLFSKKVTLILYHIVIILACRKTVLVK